MDFADPALHSTGRCRLIAVGLQRGRVCDKGELGVLVGRIRKQLSAAAEKTQERPD